MLFWGKCETKMLFYVPLSYQYSCRIAFVWNGLKLGMIIYSKFDWV